MNAKASKIPYWISLTIVLCSGWMVMWVYRQSLPTVFPEMGVSLGLNPSTAKTQLGLIVTCFFAAYTLMQFPSGVLVDRFGQKKILIPGFILFLIAPFIIVSTDNINTIYLASIFAGAGCGSYYSVAYSLVKDNIGPDKRSLATAIINSGTGLGMAITLIGASYLVKTAGYPWQTTMYIAGTLIFFILVAFLVVIKNKQNLSNQAPLTKQHIAPHVDETKSSFMCLFSRKMISMYAIYFATCYGYYMIVTWLPTFLQTERGFQGTAIGFSAALVAISSIPAALIFSRLADKYATQKAAFIIGLEIAATLMLICIVLFENETLLVVSLILYGFLGKLAVEPILISYLGEIAPKQGYGKTLGLFNTFGIGSAIVAPPLTGFIIDTTGSQLLAFYVAVGILIFSIIIFMLFGRKIATHA